MYRFGECYKTGKHFSNTFWYVQEGEIVSIFHSVRLVASGAFCGVIRSDPVCRLPQHVHQKKYGIPVLEGIFTLLKTHPECECKEWSTFLQNKKKQIHSVFYPLHCINFESNGCNEDERERAQRSSAATFYTLRLGEAYTVVQWFADAFDIFPGNRIAKNKNPSAAQNTR